MANRFTARMRRVLAEHGAAIERENATQRDLEAEQRALAEEIALYEAKAEVMIIAFYEAKAEAAIEETRLGMLPGSGVPGRYTPSVERPVAVVPVAEPAEPAPVKSEFSRSARR